MRTTVRSRIWFGTAAAIIVTAAMALAAIGSFAKGRVREISLVARGMAFYVEGESVPNPALRVRPGERLRITVRNDAPGLVHDLAVDAVSAATEPLNVGQLGSVEFTAPGAPGSYEYHCRPHALMMRGVLTVSD
jgi:plastocyanin